MYVVFVAHGQQPVIIICNTERHKVDSYEQNLYED